MSKINIENDLIPLEDEIKGLNEQLQQVISQRMELITKIQQVSGAAAYIRGKIQAEEEKEKFKDKPKPNK